MTHLQIPIVKQRQLRPMALLTGLLAMGLLAYYTYVYVQDGRVPVLDELVRLLGLERSVTWFYVGTLVVLLLLVFPFLQTVLKQKRVKNGLLLIEDNGLYIEDGDERFQVRPKEMAQLELDILSSKALEKRRQLGGNFIKIPTTKGLFRCEFHLKNETERAALLAWLKGIQEKIK